MKKVVSLLLALIMAFSLVACGDKKTNDEPNNTDKTDTVPYKIGIVTGSVSQSEDDRRGAEAFQKEYGEDMVQLAIYPDNFTEETETTIQSIVNLSADPLMKAIIVNQAVPGTTEAFRKIKEARPDIICIAGESHEDLPEIGSAADLVTNNDFVSRGYLIIRTAHELGCDTFVHISFPRHMSYETMSRRVAIMKAACEEFDMKFVLETAPDPTSDVGVSGAQAYILEQVPAWVEKYGQKAAYFCTNDAHTEPLLKRLLECGGYFIEADLPSPLMGYPGALGLDLTEEAGDFEKILTKVESAIVEKGGVMFGWDMGALNGNPMGIAIYELVFSFVILVINGKFFVSGTKAIFHRAPNMDTLVSMGSGISFVYSVALMIRAGVNTMFFTIKISSVLKKI